MPCRKLIITLRLKDKVRPDIERQTSDLTLVQKENNACLKTFEVTSCDLKDYPASKSAFHF
jgi:hypothetical protein